jgi:hypothetical protein
VTIALKLTHDEPRLVFLALVYHLGRPGSELDPETKLPSAHGLRDVKLALGNHLLEESAVVELDAEQLRRLLSAMYGSVNELRMFHMRNGAESTVERFTSTARDLFPALREDPEAALDVAEAMMQLHRRIDRALRQSAPPPEPSKSKGIWPFRR